jgi:hypothetical protein
MRLFIQIRDGVPFEHPIIDDNFRQAFPEVDTSNLPSEFANFIRIDRPKLKTFEKNQRVEYVWDGDVVKDFWTAEQMTDEEVVAKKNEIELNAAHLKSYFLNIATEKMNYVADEHKIEWQNYIDRLNSWVLTDYENVDVPKIPRHDLNNIILSTSSPGSQPDVTD